MQRKDSNNEGEGRTEWHFASSLFRQDCITLHSPQITTSYALLSAEVTISLSVDSDSP